MRAAYIFHDKNTCILRIIMLKFQIEKILHYIYI